jgi:putative tryptophan/tyrosine transport system substrate-binding protein
MAAASAPLLAALVAVRPPLAGSWHATHRVPGHKLRTSFYTQSDFARDGGLFSYGVAPVDIFRRAASYVDRILRGAKPGDLPVQFPAKYEMVVNLKTAKALGLMMPQSILLSADEVIE